MSLTVEFVDASETSHHTSAAFPSTIKACAIRGYICGRWNLVYGTTYIYQEDSTAASRARLIEDNESLISLSSANQNGPHLVVHVLKNFYAATQFITSSQLALARLELTSSFIPPTSPLPRRSKIKFSNHSPQNRHTVSSGMAAFERANRRAAERARQLEIDLGLLQLLPTSSSKTTIKSTRTILLKNKSKIVYRNKKGLGSTVRGVDGLVGALKRLSVENKHKRERRERAEVESGLAVRLESLTVTCTGEKSEQGDLISNDWHFDLNTTKSEKEGNSSDFDE